MKKLFFLRKKLNLQFLLLIPMMIIPVFLGACSSSYERGEPLRTADEMMQGPGMFSGDKGGYYIAGGKRKPVASESVSSMSAKETSKVIDQKLEQLKQDQIELEALKKELNKKL